LNGKTIEGPQWVQEIHDFMSLPLFVRPNSVIPLGSHSDRPDYDYSDNVTLQIYQLEDGKQVSVELPGLDGQIETRFDINNDGHRIYIQRQGSAKAWNVLLIGIDAIEEMESAETINGSTLIKLHENASEITVRVK
jgi:alpha-D-xyloside xylohydrolase